MHRLQTGHPLPLMVYFTALIVLTVFTTHPLLLGLSLIGAVALRLFYGGVHGGWWLLILAVLLGLMNPLFCHDGNTVLFTLFSLPFTLESVAYGVNIALMLAAVLMWCGCAGQILPAERQLSLWGKTAPRLALTLCMAQRFLPLLTGRLTQVRQAQRALGVYATGSVWRRCHSELMVLLGVMGWSLEQAVVTARSMTARGYGLSGGTHYMPVRFTRRDAALLTATLLLTAVVCVGMAFGGGEFAFYPTLSGVSGEWWPVVTAVAFGLLALLPMAAEGKEEITWRCCKSKI